MNFLSGPIGSLARPTHTVEPVDSIMRAANCVRENGDGVVPVVESRTLIGQIGGPELLRAVGEDCDLTAPAQSIMGAPRFIRGWQPAAEALRVFAGEERPACLFVVDADMTLIGVVAPSDLFPRTPPVAQLGRIGGMATPFGVYLTNGAVTSGTRWWALSATGAVMFVLLVAGSLLADWAVGRLPSAWPTELLEFLAASLTFLIFLSGMRLLPLSGIHAAEHMVVHALERGEPLDPDVVRRMPRVHPRCGTNLAAGAGIFSGVFAGLAALGDAERFLLAALATLFLWQPVGSFLQRFFTTRTPNDRQLALGIQSGQELMRNAVQARHTTANLPRRILNMGLLQVILGSLAMAGLATLIGYLFHIPELQVF